MYSFLVDNNSEHKKANGVNKNGAEEIIHTEYKDALFNPTCLRHSRNRTQSKYHRLGTYKISKIYLSLFHDKIHIPNNGYYGLALYYQG